MSDERKESLFVVSYSGRDTADQAYDALRQMEKDKQVDIKTAMVVNRKDNGKLKLRHKRRLTVGKGLVAGGAVGLLVGGAAAPAILGGAAIGACSQLSCFAAASNSGVRVPKAASALANSRGASSTLGVDIVTCGYRSESRSAQEQAVSVSTGRKTIRVVISLMFFRNLSVLTQCEVTTNS